ncbi:hypothetical protein AALD01_02440 [Oscillospiraceae bacterium 21-37]
MQTTKVLWTGDWSQCVQAEEVLPLRGIQWYCHYIEKCILWKWEIRA